MPRTVGAHSELQILMHKSPLRMLRIQRGRRHLLTVNNLRFRLRSATK